MVTMAFEGDMVGIDACTIAFDVTQLAVTPDVVVPGTLDQVQQLLNEEPGRDSLGPFKSSEANVRTTKTREMGYFSFPVLAPLLGMDLTARQVFELVVPVLIEAGLQDACSGLINFMTVALVLPTEDIEVPVTVWAQAGRSGYTPGPVAIINRRTQALYRDLPCLRPSAGPPSSPSDPALVDVAWGMRDMVIEARSERNARLDTREENRRPKSVREKMGDTITDRLLLLCRASCDEELPRLYQEWAARTKGVSERWIFQQAVESSCAVL
jgi:hypothetical protein